MGLLQQLTGAEPHWAAVRAKLEARRQELWDQGLVVCSTETYFPAGTKLGWKDQNKTLDDYSIAELEATLARRRKRHAQEAIEDFRSDPLTDSQC